MITSNLVKKHWIISDLISGECWPGDVRDQELLNEAESCNKMRQRLTMSR